MMIFKLTRIQMKYFSKNVYRGLSNVNKDENTPYIFENSATIRKIEKYYESPEFYTKFDNVINKEMIEGFKYSYKSLIFAMNSYDFDLLASFMDDPIFKKVRDQLHLLSKNQKKINIANEKKYSIDISPISINLSIKIDSQNWDKMKNEFSKQFQFNDQGLFINLIRKMAIPLNNFTIEPILIANLKVISNLFLSFDQENLQEDEEYHYLQMEATIKSPITNNLKDKMESKSFSDYVFNRFKSLNILFDTFSLNNWRIKDIDGSFIS